MDRYTEKENINLFVQVFPPPEMNINPPVMKFGFIGLGELGRLLMENLLDSNYKVIVWTGVDDESTELQKVGVDLAQTPKDVVSSADIIFGSIESHCVMNKYVLRNCLVIEAVSSGKGYVELSNRDPKISEQLSSHIKENNGRFLELLYEQAEKPVIIAAGDQDLYVDCQSCFEAVAKDSFYVGQVGSACYMNMPIQIMKGVTLAGLAECMNLAKKISLPFEDLVKVMSSIPLSSKFLEEKMNGLINGQVSTCPSVQNIKKDLDLARKTGDVLIQPLPLTSFTNEFYKQPNAFDIE